MSNPSNYRMAHKIAREYTAVSKIRLFLDDMRDPTEYGLHNVLWIKNYKEAIEQLRSGNVTWISFDHDLGEEKTGYDVAKYIEENVFHKKLPCPEWQIHSANPKGRQNIEMAMKSAERFKMSSRVACKYAENILLHSLLSSVTSLKSKFHSYFPYDLPNLKWVPMQEKQLEGPDEYAFISDDFKTVNVDIEKIQKDRVPYQEVIIHELGHILNRALGDTVGIKYFSKSLNIPGKTNEIFAQMTDYVVNKGHSGGDKQTQMYQAVCDKLNIKKENRVKPGNS